LLQITAYLYRFLNRARYTNAALSHAAILHSEEIQRAKHYWLKTKLQSDMFPNEISALIWQYPVPKDSSLRALNFIPYFADDGLIRIRLR